MEAILAKPHAGFDVERPRFYLRVPDVLPPTSSAWARGDFMKNNFTGVEVPIGTATVPFVEGGWQALV